MNKFVMFLYAMVYIFLIPIALICDFRRKYTPNFLKKFFEKLELRLNL